MVIGNRPNDWNIITNILLQVLVHLGRNLMVLNQHVKDVDMVSNIKSWSTCFENNLPVSSVQLQSV
jgi:hypothetical protein